MTARRKSRSDHVAFSGRASCGESRAIACGPAAVLDIPAQAEVGRFRGRLGSRTGRRSKYRFRALSERATTERLRAARTEIPAQARPPRKRLGGLRRSQRGRSRMRPVAASFQVSQINRQSDAPHRKRSDALVFECELRRVCGDHSSVERGQNFAKNHRRSVDGAEWAASGAGGSASRRRAIRFGVRPCVGGGSE